MERTPSARGRSAARRTSDRVELAAWDGSRRAPPWTCVVLREVPTPQCAPRARKGPVQLVVNAFPPGAPRRCSRTQPASTGATGRFCYLGFSLEDPGRDACGGYRARGDRAARAHGVASRARPTETLTARHWARDESLVPTPHDPAAAAGCWRRPAIAAPTAPAPSRSCASPTSLPTTTSRCCRRRRPGVLADAGIAAELRPYDSPILTPTSSAVNQMFSRLDGSGGAGPYRNLFHSIDPAQRGQPRAPVGCGDRRRKGRPALRAGGARRPATCL
jgi:hypothetical protein